MNWAELIKKAEKNGYRFLKHGGNHDFYYNEKKKDLLIVERHKSQEVRKGLLQKILKQIEK